jgi:hypothetical protein
MENKLIQIYLFVCQIYDTDSETCFQRLSNNSEPLFTDQEIITIWFFAHLNAFSQKKQMHTFIKNYWFDLLGCAFPTRFFTVARKTR